MWTRFVSEIINILAFVLIGASLILKQSLQGSFDATAMQVTLASMQPIADPKIMFPDSLAVCPGMMVSNQPYPLKNRNIMRYQKTVAIKGVELAIAPVEAACLSSGFGPRYGRAHEGIDLFHRDPVKIFAAAPGIIKEKRYHPGFGKMIVVDHGSKTYTRYAHLEAFASGLDVGDYVVRGRRIGRMGNTADYPIPRHLHYEVLTGHWNAETGSFGLDPLDVFAFATVN